MHCARTLHRAEIMFKQRFGIVMPRPSIAWPACGESELLCWASWLAECGECDRDKARAGVPHLQSAGSEPPAMS